MKLNYAQILVIVLILIILVYGLSACSSLTDRHDTDFELEVTAKDCKELRIEGYRGEAKTQESTDQGTKIKLR